MWQALSQLETLELQANRVRNEMELRQLALNLKLRTLDLEGAAPTPPAALAPCALLPKKQLRFASARRLCKRELWLRVPRC